MKDFYDYIIDVNNGEDRKNLFIFYSRHNISLDSLFDRVQLKIRNEILITKIIIILSDLNRKIIENKYTEEELSKLLSEASSKAVTPDIFFCYFDKTGDFDIKSYKGNSSLSQEFLVEAYEYGVANIIQKRNVIVESTSSFHYVKPSKMHTDRFIRSSNMLEAFAETTFISIRILKYINNNINAVYVDTSAIKSLIYNAIDLYSQLSGKNPSVFVDSFNSYSGIDNYPFSSLGSTLVVISASTSSGLARRLKAIPSLPSCDILTVLYNSQNEVIGNALFDFRKLSKNKFLTPKSSLYFRPINSYDERECEKCRNGTFFSIQLTDDQFVIEQPRYSSYLPVNTDSSEKLRDLISRYRNSNIFKCLYDSLPDNSGSEFFVDTVSILQHDSFKKRLDSSIKRNFPLWANYIFYCDDYGAKEIAEYIKNKILESNPAQNIALMSVIEIRNLDDIHGAAIVAGSTQTGKSLLKISRELRKFENIPLTYFVGFSKYNDHNLFEKIKSDLTYSNSEIGHHKFVSIEEMMLPVSEHRSTSWVREADEFRKIAAFLESQEPSHEKDIKLHFVSERLKFLREATSDLKRGVGDNIYLPTPDGKQLFLRKSFAFWNSTENSTECLNQGIVHYTIASVLQGLRHGKSRDNSNAPLQESYIVNQLSPMAFDRYNDGIIQAALLRNAKPKELDFSKDRNNSAIITNLICHAIETISKNDNNSDALNEFLMALCIKNLKITDIDFREIANKYISVPPEYLLTNILLEFLHHRDMRKDTPVPF